LKVLTFGYVTLYTKLTGYKVGNLRSIYT